MWINSRLLPPVCGLWLLLLVGGAARADQGRTFTHPQINKSEDLRWLTESWNGNDTPFRNAATSIDQQIHAGAVPATLAAQLQMQADQAPANALAQFRWGYATYRAAQNQKITLDASWLMIQPVVPAMMGVPSPHSYSFDRLLYLLRTFGGIPAIAYESQFEHLGWRLLNKNPRDDNVLAHQAILIDYSYVPAKMQTARTIALRLVQAHPRDSDYQCLLAGAYYCQWCASKKRSDADAAIAAYQKYLQMAPSSNSFCKSAQTYIVYIAQRQAIYDKQGN